MKSIVGVKEYQNLINGNLAGASSGETSDSVDPSTGKVWAKIPRSSIEDVEQAVASAHDAFPGWAALSATERSGLMLKIADVIAEHASELAELETRDCGWVIRETTYGSVPILQQLWQDAAGAASVAARGETVQIGPTSFGYTIREPLGVVVGIIPWNSPLFTFTIKAAYALAAGNTVIIKPSEAAAVSSLRYGELISKILPPGVLNVISGQGREIGDALVGHPDVAKVSLTGSGGTAKSIAHATADNPKPLTFELGGKSPNIVFADADIEKAVEGVTTYGIFTGNAGQLCVGGSRILIQRPIFDTMLQKMKEKIDSDIKLGHTLDFETTMGPIATKAQYDSVRSYIQVGLEEGGELVFGGKSSGENLMASNPELAEGYWVEPTLLKVPNNSLRVCQEEIFGPVAVVMPFDTEEEALALANDTSFGLAAGVWTSNLGRAQRMIQNLQSGSVWVNTYLRVGIELPFGGVKSSGFGTDSIMQNTREKACVIEIG